MATQYFSPDITPDLKLIVKIKTQQKITGGQRVIFGVFAGQARLTAVVELFDIKDNETIGNFYVVGKTMLKSIYGESIEHAISYAIEQIVSIIKQHK